jgi:tellurite resistance protein TerC
MGTVASPTLWIGFVVFVLGMLALDLGVFHRKAHAVPARGGRSGAPCGSRWPSRSTAGVWWKFGPHARRSSSLTGYLIEKSLSVDNIFVFIVIFGALAIPKALQHRVLFWGILGALVMRGVMIFAGAALLHAFHWLIYVFGGSCCSRASRMLMQRGRQDRPRAQLPRDAHRAPLDARVATASRATSFFTRIEVGARSTPLFLALLVVEAPTSSSRSTRSRRSSRSRAIRSSSSRRTSSRSSACARCTSCSPACSTEFRYLKFGLALVLVFVGAKMVMLDVSRSAGTGRPRAYRPKLGDHPRDRTRAQRRPRRRRWSSSGSRGSSRGRPP